MSIVHEIQSCFDVTDEMIAESMRPDGGELPWTRVSALLSRMARVASPRRGAPKLLVVLAEMAQRDWFDSTLEVQVVRRADPQSGVIAGCEVHVLSHDGQALSPLCEPLVVAAPFEELAQVARVNPAVIAPLVLVYDEEGAIRLSTSASPTPPGMDPSSLLRSRPPRTPVPSPPPSRRSTPRPARPTPPAPPIDPTTEPETPSARRALSVPPPDAPLSQRPPGRDR